jgi:hypothetical protein
MRKKIHPIRDVKGVKITVALPAGRDRITCYEAEDRVVERHDEFLQPHKVEINLAFA